MKIGTVAQYAEAVCDCTLALAYDPLHNKSLYRRGVSLAMLGRWQAAFDGMSNVVFLTYLTAIAAELPCPQT